MESEMGSDQPVGRYPIDKEQLRLIISSYASSQANLQPIEDLGGVAGIAKCLDTDLKDGISPSEELTGFKDRIEAFGVNRFPAPPHKSFFQLFWSAFEDSTIVILVLAATISLVLGVTVGEHETEWIEGVAIFIAVIIVALVSSINEYQKERQFRALNDVKNDKKVKVIRGGQESETSIHDLMVGDVVNLVTGDAIPADGLYIGGHEMKTDESAMTGETHEIKKDARNPVMLSGTQLSAGVGMMLLTAVGPDSEWGITLSHLQEDNDPTPLQEKLESVAATIGKMGLFIAIITFLVLFISWIVPVARQSQAGVPFDVAHLRAVVNFFIIAVTIVVVAVPEGLPLAVTISLAYSMKEMMKENNLVRHLEACETMGGATNICSDKTGTLTENVMSVEQAYYGGVYYDHAPTKEDMPSPFLDIYAELVSANSTAFLEERTPEIDEKTKAERKKAQEAALKAGIPLPVVPPAPPTDIMKLEKLQLKVVGNKTEGAFLLLAHGLGVNYQKVRQATPVYKLWPFSSERKRMTVIVRRKSGGLRLYQKGSSEWVLKDCVSVLNTDGSVHPMTEAERSAIDVKIEEIASQGLRTLILAYRDLDDAEDPSESAEAPEDSMIFLGLMGIKDPVRKAVPEAVYKCHRAGITVRMVTGDNLETARFIATECKILDESRETDHSEEALRYRVLQGPVFRNLPRAKLDIALKHIRVLARSSPSDKHLLVSRLRELGEVVAVTGDGTNDAPALKVADVGLSMGITGTDVAKEASDIVIMDDNFASIVAAVKWGRGVYDNIRKFIQFQVTVNIVALATAFIGAVSQRGTPLTAVQLLWVNLIMDTLAALALGTEVPEEKLLLKKPYGRFDRLISGFMWRNILGQSVYQVAVLMVLLYLGPQIWNVIDGSRTHYTIIFNTFVFMQIFNEFNSRKVNNEINIFSNFGGSFTFLIVMISTLALQILLVTFGGDFSQTIAISITQWLACVGIGAWSLVIGLAFRLMPVPLIKNSSGPVEEEKKEEKKPIMESSDSDTDSDDEPIRGRVGSISSLRARDLKPIQRQLSINQEMAKLQPMMLTK